MLTGPRQSVTTRPIVTRTTLTRWLAALLAFGICGSLRAQEAPAGLPKYELDIILDTANREAKVRQVVTWTNQSSRSVKEIVFNAHAHYSIPDADIGRLAKTVELLRVAPKEALNFDGPPLAVESVQYHGLTNSVQATSTANKAVAAAHVFAEDNATALRVKLPEEVAPGDSARLELNLRVKIPAKRGRWGQWDSITTLAQWLPVVAVLDDVKGWQPTPFVPWHQPYFNDAGVYHVKLRLPADQKLAASSSVRKETKVSDGWKEIEFEPACLRDFALVASARFEETTAEADGVKIRCLALPEHSFYAKVFVDAAKEAIPIYNQWFGRYPYAQFTIAEGCLGWAGNECGGLVIIEDRMFNMPHIAKDYPKYLLQHELCHQWWYNTIGTNGYAETWMDEGFATYFSHRLADHTAGKNNALLEYPKGLGWLPNIRRNDLRTSSMIGVRARGELQPPVQEMQKYGHLVNLTAASYDRGGKIVGQIEERMGEPAFLDFMRHIYQKYQFRILRVADFQRELETFTGHSWDEFFRHWVHSTGMCDWKLAKVELDEERITLAAKPRRATDRGLPRRLVVHVEQQGAFNEPTTLGLRLQSGDEYQIRIPIHPDVPVLELPELHAVVYCTSTQVGGKHRAQAKIEIALPSDPVQISIDPDRMLLDEVPTNNHWKSEFRWRLTPLYSQLDEVDVTNAVDRWNFTVGPWIYFNSYSDPWYTKSLMAGLRAGVYRTQEFQTGAFLGYRANDRNIVAGADVLWDHVPFPRTQVGASFEHSLDTIGDNDFRSSRGVIFGRYVIMYGSSLYLPPFEYVEVFGVGQNRCLPAPRVMPPSTDPFHDRVALGMHYHKNLMTPYWDPEGGYALDVAYQYGLPIFGNDRQFHQLYGQFAVVKGLGKVREWFGEGAIRNWLADTRLAFRLGGATALPDNGLFFALGGGDNFRGFDLDERQGNLLWLASAEWRVPIMTNLHYDFVDHVAGVRNVYAAPFYDVGNAYVRGHQQGPIAHAFGAGLRVDVSWLGMIERTTLRFDFAKTVNGVHPWQFWFGIQHPF